MLPENIDGPGVQRLAVTAGNILLFNFGLLFGSTPSHSELYESDQTPLKYKIDEDAESWITGYLFLMSSVGALLSGSIAQRIGPKNLLMFMGLLQLISWFCIHFATDIIHIYFSRIFAGAAAGAAFVVLPLFILEVAEPKAYTRLLSTLEYWRTFGIFLGFVASIYVPYVLIPIIGILTSCFFCLTFPFVRESPLYYLRNKDEKNLEKSLRWFRGIRKAEDQNKKEYLLELNELKKKMAGGKPNDIYKLPRIYFWKLLFITTVFAGSVELCGIYAILNDLGEKFGMIYGSVLVSTETGSLLIAASQVIAGYISGWLVHKLRRKVQLIGCALICALSALALAMLWKHSHGRYIYTESYWYEMLGLLTLYVVSAQIGLLPISNLIIGELIPAKWRNKITSFSWAVSYLLVFLHVKFFNYINMFFDVKYWYWFFTGTGVFIALFSLIFLPETKDRTPAEIQEIMGYPPHSDVAKANTVQEGYIQSEAV